MSKLENTEEKNSIDRDYYTSPVISCFLIDESGSMEGYREDVIKNQPVMLDTLRKSEKCEKNALCIIQILFSGKVKVLHELTKLSADGKDKVVVLNDRNYNPNGSTALYKSTFHILQYLKDAATRAKVKFSFTIGIISDGEDTDKGIDPKDIRTLIQEFTEKDILRSSVIVGLTNKDFTEDKLEELKKTLGFQQAIPLSKDPKAIRRAFKLASKIAVAGQK